MRTTTATRIPTTTTRMTTPIEAEGLVKLLTWLSPAFPIGAFSYSHGLEWAIEAGDVTSLDDLVDWVGDVLDHGAGLVDATLLRAAARADDAGLAELCELAAALFPSRERRLESLAQGDAFLATACAAWPAPGLDRIAAVWSGPGALPVAVGVPVAAHGVDTDAAVTGYLHAFTANLVSAAVRLVPLGQTDGQHALRRLMPVAARVGALSRARTPETVGGIALRSDIASMRHEAQYTRLFRS